MEINNVERIILTGTIRNLEDTLSAASEINAELRQQNNGLKLAITRLDGETCEMRYELLKKDEQIANLEREMSNSHKKCDEIATRYFAKSLRRRDIIQLLKRKVSRLEKKIETWKFAAKEWQTMSYFYRSEMFARETEIASLKAQLENARKEIATTDEIPVSEICEVEFNDNTNFTYGYAPCGNGCKVEKINGRYIDVHEITCEDNPEFVGIWLD